MSYSEHWMKKAKWLTQALIISGTLNIGLVATFIYFVLKEKQSSLSFELKPHQSDRSSFTNKDLVGAYSNLGFQDLLLRLEDKELIEEGYVKRDLALSCLVNFHHFNLEGALSGFMPQQRSIKFFNDEGGEVLDLLIFPGLSDDQFQGIIHYAKTEKWPFTSEGLFFEIKRGVSDPSLYEAFYLSPEFQAVHTLFIRGGLAVSKEEIVFLLAEGDFEILDSFTKEQKVAQDLSNSRLKDFLLRHLTLGSKRAATWLLNLDLEFMCKRLDDNQTILALGLLKERSTNLDLFAKDLLISPRSDLVWKKAASVLYAVAGEPMAEPFDHNAAMARFLPHLVTSKKIEQVVQVFPAKKLPEKLSLAPPSKKIYIVQEGDSLWKIARKHKTSVEAIMKANHLETDKLRKGRKLEIPGA